MFQAELTDQDRTPLGRTCRHQFHRHHYRYSHRHCAIATPTAPPRDLVVLILVTTLHMLQNLGHLLAYTDSPMPGAELPAAAAAAAGDGGAAEPNQWSGLQYNPNRLWGHPAPPCPPCGGNNGPARHIPYDHAYKRTCKLRRPPDRGSGGGGGGGGIIAAEAAESCSWLNPTEAVFVPQTPIAGVVLVATALLNPLAAVFVPMTHSTDQMANPAEPGASGSPTISNLPRQGVHDGLQGRTLPPHQGWSGF